MPKRRSKEGKEEKTDQAGKRPAAAPLSPPPLPQRSPSPPPLSQRRPERVSDLLGDLPAPPPVAAPPPEPPPDPAAVEEAVRAGAAYEKELRDNLAKKKERPQSPLRRHALVLSLLGGLVLASAAGLAAYRHERAATKEADIARFLAAAQNGLSRDTYAAYRASVSALDGVLELAPDHLDALRLKAEILATLVVSYGVEQREAAAALLAVLEERAPPDAALVARWILASESDTAKEELEELEAEILLAEPAESGAGVLSLAGAIFLERGEPTLAIERFNAAILAGPGHVPTLVRVGDYYRLRAEHLEALRYYGLALAVSEDHPAALLGAAEARLETARERRELEAALEALGKIQSEEQVPLRERPRLSMVRARLLTATGDRARALEELSRLKISIAEGAPWLASLAETYILIGAADEGLLRFHAFDFDEAEDSALRELYAKMLVAAERYREAAELGIRGGERGLRLQVGIAQYHLGQRSRARSTLHATVQDKKLPMEAVVYLGLIDLAQGRGEKARKNLERLGTGSTAKTIGRWAWAEFLWKRGDLEGAERTLREAIEVEPRAVEARCSLGRLLAAQGRDDEARPLLEEAIDLAPLHSEARRELGRLLSRSGEEAAAIEHWEAVLDQHPNEEEGVEALVSLLIREGRVDRAIARAEAIARVSPNHAKVQQALGTAYFARGEMERALGALTESTRLSPRDPLAWIHLAEAQLALGDGRAAASSMGRAARLRPRALAVDLGLARLELAQKKAVPAERRLTALLAGTRAPKGRAAAEAHALLARALLDMGPRRAGKARAEAQRAVEADERSWEAHLALGLALQQAGERSEAIQSLRTAISLLPGAPEPHLALGRLLAEAGAPEEAAEALRRYLELAPRGAGAGVASKLLEGIP